jgi:hypothetical protein
MIRILFASLFLTGCSLWDPKPASPKSVLEDLDKRIDKADSKVAAAVTVMVENKAKPAVVENEGKVALAHLQPPADADLKEARERASKGDPKAYSDEQAKAKEMLAKVESDWQSAKLQAQINETQLTELRKKLADVDSKSDRNMWTMAGVIMLGLGGVASALMGPRVGIPLILCAALAGAYPYVFESVYFAYVMACTLTLASAILLWWMFDFVRDRVNAVDSPKKKAP